MIPLFPKFKKLELDDRFTIEAITNAYPPSSDYNFAGLWSYNSEENIEVSLCNNNIVLKTYDYITRKPFYSFFGTQKFLETANTLLKYAKKQKNLEELKLIPDFIVPVTVLKSSEDLIFEEDIDNYDYILSVSEIVKLQGEKYRAKKNFVNRFLKTYPVHTISILDIQKHSVQKEIEELFYTWEKNKGTIRKENDIEFIALKRLMESASHFFLQTIGIYSYNKLVAFSIDEIVQKKYGIIHFEKADVKYIGVFQYLKQLTAKHFQKMGCEFINYEQDLGLEGLRKAKKSWNPIFYIKKYIIKRKPIYTL